MRLPKHPEKWWTPTGLPPNRPRRIPKHLRDVDPAHTELQLPMRRSGKVGAFAPSRKWTRYKDIQGIDVGYITPVYSLAEIAERYGLSHNARKYFRRHILPEPFDIVRRRATNAHHWSRFTFMVLDYTLKDLESLGYHQFLKSFEDHVQNVQNGVAFLQDYYERREDEREFDTGDEFGVTWG